MASRTSLLFLPLLAASAVYGCIYECGEDRGGTPDLQVQPKRPAFERRQLIQTAFSSAGFLALSTVFSEPAFAGANVIIDEIKIRESIKGIKESVDALQLYEDFVKQKDLFGVKKALRTPPVSEIRRDCRRVIGGLEGPLKTDSDKAYGKFIESLETVDLIATRGIQSGKDLEEKQVKELNQAYAKAQGFLNDFLKAVLSSRFGTELDIKVE